MNIQFRDSKPLQDAIKLRAGRNLLPKAQLHPEMLNGIVECDREGFIIRSEVLFGVRTGEPNEIDLVNMSAFLGTGGDTCTARWTVTRVKQGDSVSAIPQELVFQFDKPNAGKLVIRTQSREDVNRLVQAIPADRETRFEASYDVGHITLIRAAGQAEIPTVTKTIPQLKLAAAKAGVKWDSAASTETMAERIDDATKAKHATK